MTAVAYIRRSASEESPVSEEAQRETVAKLAAEQRHTIEHVYRDWGRSGGAEDRPQYLAMLERIERGGVKAVYAYDQDRLARSQWLFAGLLRLADLHGFAVRTPAGNLADDRHRDFAELRGIMDGIELRKMKRRAEAINRKQNARKDDRGMAPFGYDWAPREKRSSEPVRFVKTDPEGIAHVIDTYERVGTFAGTARALNAEGFRSKRDGDWHPVTVSDLIRREAPDLAAHVHQGERTRPRRARLFRGLLRCYCGGPMTPSYGGTQRKRKDGTIVNLEGSGRYYCGRGALRGAHPKPHYIAEARIRPWIEEEAARLRLPSEVELDGEQVDDSADVAAIAALRAAGRTEMADELQRDLDTRRAGQGDRARIVQAVPAALDWTWATEDVNAWLRAAFEYVQLGADLLPVEAVWRVPGWRSE